VNFKLKNKVIAEKRKVVEAVNPELRKIDEKT
jgi:hypothetical protein